VTAAVANTTAGATGPANSTTSGTPSSVPVWTNPAPTTAQGWGGWKPDGGHKGGDTEPGHGVDAGRGALPGCKGQGNNPVPGYNSTGGSTPGGPSGSVTGAVSGHAAGYVPSNRHQSNANLSSNSSSPAYYVNGAGSLSVSAAMLVGAAVLGFFL
jgi:hypothetical protein